MHVKYYILKKQNEPLSPPLPTQKSPFLGRAKRCPDPSLLRRRASNPEFRHGHADTAASRPFVQLPTAAAAGATG